METLRSDLTYVVRTTLRRPATALICVLTLSLGVGASTAMFSVVESVLFRPLPYPEPERLVSVYPGWPDMRGHPTLGGLADRGSWSWPEYFGVAERQTVFEAMAAYELNEFVTLHGEGPPERVEVALATWELFPMLGVVPAAGRLFDSGDRRESGVLLLSQAEWQTRYGGEPDALGRVLTIDDRPHVIVGVLPESFTVEGERPPFWTVMTGSLTDEGIANHGSTRTLARLAPGMTIDRAAAELTNIFTDVLPPDHGTHVGSIFPRHADETRRARPIILMMLGASVLLLLVACGNAAALLLGAGMDRERELAIRGAVGASRGRLITQLVTESAVLGTLAGLGGLIAAILLTEVLLFVAPSGIPGLAQASIDGVVLAFALGTAVACGVACGMIPGLSLSTVHVAGAIGSSRGTTQGRARLQSTVVVVELAFATVLTVSGLLLARTVMALGAVDPAFDIDPLAVVAVDVPDERFVSAEGEPDFAALFAYYRRMREEVAAIAGVEAVASTSVPPLTGYRQNNAVVPEGWDSTRAVPSAERRFVSDNFFDVSGIDLVDGRAFESADYTDADPDVVIVSRGLAELAWPGESALGKRLGYEAAEGLVVGVAENVNDERLQDPTLLAYYLPIEYGQLLVRALGDPAVLLPSIRERISAVDGSVPVTMASPLSELVAAEMLDEGYRARLMAIFAVFAAALALLGVYGVTSRSVARRTKELGIRLALGARTVSVHRMITAQAVQLALYGVLAGIGLALVGGGILARFTWGVSVADPLALAAVLLVFPAFAAVAALGPARRATRVDPLEVLNAE